MLVLAKPRDDLVTGQPITLDDHTEHVETEAKEILDARPFISQKYALLTGKNLRKSVMFCARWHDEGKKHPVWQSACQADYKLWKSHPHLRAHNLMKSGIRHEMDSLVQLKASGEAYTKSDLVAIAAHHGKLSRRFANRWNDDPHFQPFWTEFLDWGNRLRWTNSNDFEAAVLKRYLFDGPRAVLQLADHRASARESGEALPELTPFVFNFPHKVKRGVQAIIETLWDEPLAILRAPTGAGKTDAALLWARHQIEAGFADRLIIAMPTRFTSNALAIGAAENLAEIGVYHSTSYFNRKKQKQHKGIYEDNWTRKENELARQLETPVTVTTLDHLCIALTGAREDHHSIFWGMAHSCVVIDEADFYDEFTQYNLVTLLRALKALNVRVLIMSATVPNSSLGLYRQSGFNIDTIFGDAPPKVWSEKKKVEWEKESTRPRCDIHMGRVMALPTDISNLLQKSLDGTPTIIYANTVKRAQEYVNWFEFQGFTAKKPEEDSKKVFALYHSRFTEPDKAKKEAQLIEMLGKDAWDEDKPGKPYGVAILTQIGELSVNISADFMISDFCPIDRLAQRAGRLSRFGKQIGELHVIVPMKSNKSGETVWYPAPYGKYEGREGWVASEALTISREWLKSGQLSASDWIEGVNVIYPSLKIPENRTTTNKQKLEKSLIVNWMLVQAAEVGEDEEGTKDWKSRDVPTQKKVYVLQGNPSVITATDEIPSTWRQFREWETETAISVLSYEVGLGIKNGKVEKHSIIVGEDTETIFIAKPNAYSFERGLVLTPDQDETEEWSPHDED